MGNLQPFHKLAGNVLIKRRHFRGRHFQNGIHRLKQGFFLHAYAYLPYARVQHIPAVSGKYLRTVQYALHDNLRRIRIDAQGKSAVDKALQNHTVIRLSAQHIGYNAQRFILRLLRLFRHGAYIVLVYAAGLAEIPEYLGQLTRAIGIADKGYADIVILRAFKP